MKKILIAAASVLMLGAPAFAQDDIVAGQNAVIEQEAGAISDADLETMSGPEADFYSDRGERIVGGIIGGIIGAIAADQYDGQYRPGRPGRGGDRWVTCFEQNRRGQYFRATARRARVAQDMAMQKCFRQSRACRPAGCR